MLEEHQRGACELTPQSWGSRDGFREGVTPERGAGLVQMKGGCHLSAGSGATNVQLNLYRHIPARLNILPVIDLM